MASLKDIKKRIGTVKNTQQITKAMKMVAAAKLRRAQDRIIQMRPYAKKLNGILKNVSAGSESEGQGFDRVRPIDNVLIVPVSSDRGLCGAFNSNIFKEVVNEINTQYKSQFDNGGITIMPIGKRSKEYFVKRNFNVIEDYSTVFLDLTFGTVRKAAEHAMNAFEKGEFDRVVIVYNEFKNVATQIVRTEQFLPIVESEENEGAYGTDYIYQPNEEEIVADLIPKSLKIQFYKAALESNASEHGARMTAMDKATENAGDLLRELRLTYNRTRQAAITKEILEIVGGAEALG